MEIENSLEAEQDFVGDLIDVYPLTDELDLVCNDNGWIDGLEARVLVLGEGEEDEGEVGKREIRTIIPGDCFVCRFDEEGNFVSINDEDVKVIKHYAKKVLEIKNGVIVVER